MQPEQDWEAKPIQDFGSQLELQPKIITLQFDSQHELVYSSVIILLPNRRCQNHLTWGEPEPNWVIQSSLFRLYIYFLLYLKFQVPESDGGIPKPTDIQWEKSSASNNACDLSYIMTQVSACNLLNLTSLDSYLKTKVSMYTIEKCMQASPWVTVYDGWQISS